MVKQLLAIRLMCCFIVSSVSSSTPRSDYSTSLRMLESSYNVRSLPETFSRICLEPNQISSVLSIFDCSLRVEHQLLASTMQCWSVDHAWWMSCTSTSTYACIQVVPVSMLLEDGGHDSDQSLFTYLTIASTTSSIQIILYVVCLWICCFVLYKNGYWSLL